MLYYTILYYTILYDAILYYTILYYTILYYTVPGGPRQAAPPHPDAAAAGTDIYTHAHIMIQHIPIMLCDTHVYI